MDFPKPHRRHAGPRRVGAALAAGARYRFNNNIQFGVGYERPITDREDIINWKIAADLVISY